MLSPSEISSKTFDKGMTGYKVDEIEKFLKIVSKDMETLIDEKKEMEEKLIILAEKIEEYREDEDSLKAALIGAQKLGEAVIKDARQRSEKIVHDANVKAEQIVNDAQRAIKNEEETLSSIQREVTIFKKRLMDIYKNHVELINRLGSVGMPQRQVKEEQQISNHIQPEKTIENIHKDKVNDKINDKVNDKVNDTSKNIIKPIKENLLEEEEFIVDISQNQEDLENDIELEQHEYIDEKNRLPLNDFKYGPLKFGDGYDMKNEQRTDQVNKTLFNRKKTYTPK